jgi:hypothetical protein
MKNEHDPCVRDKNHDPVLILGARIDVMHAVSA